MAGNELPYFTKPDYNRKGELKTKWARKNSRSKTGYSSASLPKSFGMFEQSHLWQVAGVWALNGHQPVWLLYVTDSDYLIFNETNCEELRPENLQEVAKKIMQYNKVTEKLLKTAKQKVNYLKWSAQITTSCAGMTHLLLQNMQTFCSMMVTKQLGR